MDFTSESLEGSNMLITTFDHTVESSYGDPSYTTKMQMMVNKDTGACIVGNSSEGFLLYVPDASGTVHQFAIDQSHGANASTASAQNITDFAYLLKSDNNFVDQSSGMFERSVSAYGPNGELNPFTPTPGAMKTIKVQNPDGTFSDIPIATNNEESSLNYMSEVLNAGQGKVVAGGSSSGGAGTSTGSGTTGTTGGTPSYSGVSGNGVFMKGLRGNAEPSFPWIETARADEIKNFAEDPTFAENMEFSSFIGELNTIIDQANEGIPIIMADGRSAKAGERVQMIRDAISLTEEYQRMKSAIDSGDLRNAIKAYNDNVEQAKVENKRKALRAECKKYNDTNRNVVRTYINSDPNFRPDGRYSKGIDHYDSENKPVYRYDQYDKIDYDGAWEGIDFGWGLFNMKTDRMVQELQSREIHVDIEDRPDWTM